MANATATILNTITAEALVDYNPPTGTALYQNSDNSFNVTINAGDTYVAADVRITGETGTTVDIPANTNYSFSALPISYARPGYPGSSIIYATGDAGSQLAAGAFDYDVEGLRPILADIDTLESLNAFGNTNRLTDELGGQTYANDYVVDNYTGLGWYRIPFTGSTWAAALTAANTSTLLGYSNWRVPIQLELESLVRIRFGLFVFNYGPFAVGFTNLWTSETSPSSTTQCNTFRTDDRVTPSNKTSTADYLIVRNHF